MVQIVPDNMADFLEFLFGRRIAKCVGIKAMKALDLVLYLRALAIESPNLDDSNNNNTDTQY